MRNKLLNILNSRYTATTRNTNRRVSLLDQEEFTAMVDDILNLLQRNNHPFIPPTPDPFFYVYKDLGENAIKVFHNIRDRNLGVMINDNTLWRLESFFVNEIDENTLDLRFTLSSQEDRATLNEEQFRMFVGNSHQLPNNGTA